MKLGELQKQDEMVTRNNDLLMLALSRFFAVSNHITKLISVIDGQSCVSLRLLDYFVTNYANKHKTTITKADDSIVICVHSSYKSQLKAFSKQQFDPFRRRERIIFKISEDQTIETTVGQLNFFRWAIESGVLDYVQEHKNDIEKDMYSTGSGQQQQPQQTASSSFENINPAKSADPKAPSSSTIIEKTGQSNVASQVHVTRFQVPMKIVFD